MAFYSQNALQAPNAVNLEALDNVLALLVLICLIGLFMMDSPGRILLTKYLLVQKWAFGI